MSSITKEKTEWLKLSEYAKRIGVKYQTFSLWIREGKIPESVIKQVGPGRIINVEKADHFFKTKWQNTSNNFAPIKVPNGSVSHETNQEKEKPQDEETTQAEKENELKNQDPFYVAKLKKEENIANLKEVELKEKLGQLTLVDDVERKAFEIGRRVRDAILRIPQRLAAELACETDPHQVEIFLEKELRSCLEGLGNE